ncbi:MAG TPA: YajQ family cyclic di-GMP-binding protein [Gammaproteobacteria bacterium]|nr:YajQ family cyclic di-GMP-binding protein [Gammaproteobacteria bacterium]
MPSFDVVSEVDSHELSNAIDQANREISTRFDFKGSDAKVSLSDKEIKLEAENEFQLKQISPIIYAKLGKRNIDIRCLEKGKAEPRGKRAYQSITVKQGVDKELARMIVKEIKGMKVKVQAAIQGEQVRVTGKKRDDLQQVMAMLKSSEKLDAPLQYTNFRD